MARRHASNASTTHPTRQRQRQPPARPAGSAEALILVPSAHYRQAGIVFAAIMVALASVASAAETPLRVTRCEVSLRASTTPGPRLYQYRARISVRNPGAQPVQFARVDVVGHTRDGAFSWAPIGAYFSFVPPHGAAPADNPLLLSRVMRNGLDDDRPTHGFECQVRTAGAESPARPIDD